MNVHYSGAAKKVSRRPEESSTSPAPKPTEAKDKPAESLPPKEVPKEEEKKEGPSKGAVAAAVVVSLLVAAAVAVGGFILFRRRQRQKIEEEYRRTLAARDFTKKPEMDHRLEPVMIHRRDSVGSIADNEDFSRRILKVHEFVLEYINVKAYILLGHQSRWLNNFDCRHWIQNHECRHQNR